MKCLPWLVLVTNDIFKTITLAFYVQPREGYPADSVGRQQDGRVHAAQDDEAAAKQKEEAAAKKEEKKKAALARLYNKASGGARDRSRSR